MLVLAAWVALQTGQGLLPNEPGGPQLSTYKAASELKGNTVRVQFSAGDWPNVNARYTNPADWSAFGALRMTIYNPGKEDVPFSLRIDDAPHSDGIDHCCYADAIIPAGKRFTFSTRLAQRPTSYGMRGLPSLAGDNPMEERGTIDLKQVWQWQVYLNHPTKPAVLEISNLKLIPVRDLMVLVDRYGQYPGLNWPGKVNRDEDLRRSVKGEDLKPFPVKTDRYGGWLGKTTYRATGRFRTQKVDGRWWFISPEGNPFFSFGMDCVRTGDPTIVTGRESMFEWLPKPGDPLAAYLGQSGGVLMGPMKGKTVSTVDFYRMNLTRKYGADWETRFIARSLDRLQSWGFNTVANWSDESMGKARRVPYVVTSSAWGDYARVASGIDYWGTMPDVFDPRYEAAVKANVQAKAWSKGDPYCIGWFFDNELSWRGTGEEEGRFGIAYGALGLGPTSPAKKEFVRQLQAKYHDIASLNRTWGTKFESWDQLLQPTRLNRENLQERRDDLAAFMTAYCERYFGLIARAIKELDPGALYMGCRIAWATKDAEAAQAKFCDVISYNIYAPTVDAKRWDYLKAFNKPAIIGEFHFGATDRGMFHPGLVNAKTQAGRADMYQAYVRSVLAHPSFIGCHWFQYHDEPTIGRMLDGENYNIGFIDVTDTPYPLMVNAARKTHTEAAQMRPK